MYEDFQEIDFHDVILKILISCRIQSGFGINEITADTSFQNLIKIN